MSHDETHVPNEDELFEELAVELKRVKLPPLVKRREAEAIDAPTIVILG